MRYDAHKRLAAPARPSSHPLRLLTGMVLVVVFFLPMAFFYAGFVPALLNIPGTTLLAGETPLAVVVLLFEFTFLLLSLGAVLRLLHRRGLASLLGPLPLAARQFLRCVAFLLPLYLLVMLIPMPEPYALSPNLSLGTWIVWLPLALPAVMVQIGAEEMAFRGYLQSQLAARFSHPVIWIGLPSALFGLVHFDPGLAGENAWLLALWAALFGAAAADLTARTGTLGPALGLHFANNLFAIVVTAPAGDLDGLALYTFPLDLSAEDLLWHVLPAELLFTLCAWLTARLALRV